MVTQAVGFDFSLLSMHKPQSTLRSRLGLEPSCSPFPPVSTMNKAVKGKPPDRHRKMVGFHHGKMVVVHGLKTNKKGELNGMTTLGLSQFAMENGPVEIASCSV